MERLTVERVRQAQLSLGAPLIRDDFVHEREPGVMVACPATLCAAYDSGQTLVEIFQSIYGEHRIGHELLTELLGLEMEYLKGFTAAIDGFVGNLWQAERYPLVVQQLPNYRLWLQGATDGLAVYAALMADEEEHALCVE